MALKQNIIYVYFKGKHLTTSKSQYQYNHGQFLYFADLDLPQAFEVHFSNEDKGYSKPKVGSNKLVEIPDEYFWSGASQIYAWVYLHSDTDDGETIYEVKIPLTKRAKPTDEEPLPQQESAMERAIAELNNAVEITTENANKTEEDKTQVENIRDEVVDLKENIDATAETVAQKSQEAIDASRRSEASAQNAAEFEEGARNYSESARQSAQEALESKNTAKQKAQVANDASAEAKYFRDEAETFKNEAEQAKQNIVDYRDETKGYRDEALTAKDDTQTIKSDVQSLKTQIDDTADNIFENAREAYQSMISADNASLSASESAENAGRSANEANQSATNAFESASQAEEFKNQSATNVTHYPKVVDGYWYVWDASKNEYVNTNVDARGVKGDKGDVGNGIENTVLNSDYTLTITFTDGTSYTTPSIRGEKGIKGDVGNGIASTVLNDDYTLTITFTDGTTYKTPSIRGEKGEKGEPATDMDIHICSASEYDSETRIPTITSPDDKTFYLVPTEDGTSPDLFTEWVYVNGAWEMFGSASVDLSGYLTDVTVNGTSVVTDGVAEIPIASRLNLGVIKVDSNAVNSGLYVNDGNGFLETFCAPKFLIKNGDNTYMPIVPSNQHESTFYGLAKASGDTTQSQSSNTVGTYTDEAKASIQTMLGVPSSDDVVSDVQINGTSIVEDGVANVPMCNGKLGLVNISGNYGFKLYSNGVLSINPANSMLVKAGTWEAAPITAKNQHESTFYGLAKSAGDTTQSQSSNAVGTYTEDAKSAISEMLNGSVSVSGTTPTIVAKSGIRYVCGEVATLDFTPSQTGICDVVFTSGSTPTVVTLPSTVKFPDGAFTAEADTTYEINILDGVYGAVMSWT